ncbi:MAG TPA: protein kinase, partial [Mycobacterium sp.]|nr:protein kinase [Mycobacterium sp.]
MDSDPFSTQRDVGSAIVSQLRAAGFDDASEIGHGGFGIVYRCTQVGLDRTVAIKVLTTDVDEDRERFLREQRAMGRLTGHPNIAAVLQVGETDSGYPYLVMQYYGQGSLEERIRRMGLLPVDEVLHIGVKMAGALESAHRLGILHRDVKPANILLTDYGEPVLSDFGIAHVVGGFKTAAGTFTGSPAFTAPEILAGDPPSPASDVYGLGATLFCALTGHAAYERKSGEKVLTQFLRIATEPVPDLRESDVPEDVSDAVARMMSRDPEKRPTAVAAGEELRELQSRRGLPVDDMHLPADEDQDRHGESHPGHRVRGELSVELTSFVGRGAELAEVKEQLSTSRLMTLTGIGGVGKTRLVLRAASEAAPDFPDGVRVVELGELRDGSLLVDVVAAALGIRDESARSLRDVLVEFLRPRRLLLVLDNCEQVVDEVAKLVEDLLSGCPELRILTTSRERLGVGGESVLRIAPLPYPDADDTLGGLPGYDAVALFAERAAAAVPGFRLTDENKRTVADIVSRLEGLPLAIELAAARLRAMSLDQLLERLADRYRLLTLGARGVPTRQQTLRWSVGWSYDLCTPAEQQLWSRLSVFAGSFELEAAQDVCGADMTDYELLDVLTSLVDKSILVRTESDGMVRFRLLETLREYGRQQVE